MKLLKIDNNLGHFVLEDGTYSLIDKIDKENLLRLMTHILEDDEVEMDPYDDQAVKNQAHQVIYRSIVQKLSELRGRREEFKDDAARIYLEEYEGYRK